MSHSSVNDCHIKINEENQQMNFDITILKNIRRPHFQFNSIGDKKTQEEIYNYLVDNKYNIGSVKIATTLTRGEHQYNVFIILTMNAHNKHNFFVIDLETYEDFKENDNIKFNLYSDIIGFVWNFCVPNVESCEPFDTYRTDAFTVKRANLCMGERKTDIPNEWQVPNAQYEFQLIVKKSVVKLWFSDDAPEEYIWEKSGLWYYNITKKQYFQFSIKVSRGLIFMELTLDDIIEGENTEVVICLRYHKYEAENETWIIGLQPYNWNYCPTENTLPAGCSEIQKQYLGTNIGVDNILRYNVHFNLEQMPARYEFVFYTDKNEVVLWDINDSKDQPPIIDNAVVNEELLYYNSTLKKYDTCRLYMAEMNALHIVLNDIKEKNLIIFFFDFVMYADGFEVIGMKGDEIA